MALEVSGIRFETENIGAALANIGRFNAAQDSIVTHAQQAGAGFSAAQQIIIGGLREIGSSAVELGATLGRELVQGIGASIGAAGDFGATVNRFSAVTGDALTQSGQDLEDFSALFLKLGADTQYSAQEAAEAGVNLAKGGIEPATIAAGGLTAALTLAAAGELDLAQAAEISAKQYGVWTREMTSATDKADFLAQAADRLAQAANASTVEVPELAMGLAQVGEVARGAGYSFNETVTTMGLLAPAFGSASDGATSWKAVINNLIPTTKDAISVATELGLYTKESGSAFFDAQGNFIGARDAMQLLNEATANLSEEQRILALETLFGSDGQRAASILAAEGAAGYDRMAESMQGAGTAAEQAAARQVGWNFATEQLSGSVETLSIVVGQRLIPYLLPFIDLATQGVNVLSAFAQGSDDASTQLYSFIAAVDEIIPGFQSFYNGVADALSFLADLGSVAYDYGVGIASNFAAGIASAVSFVADALSAVGDTVSYWLEPHSPPKIVPDLDRWGADAINVYLEGWTKGDFSIFESIGSLISSELRSIAEMAGSSIPRDGLIPMILGTRSAVAEAIAQLQETGEIGEEAYQKIRDAAGPAGETIAGMLELLVEQVDATEAVSQAQEEYNRVVDEFTQKLDDLKAQRDAINESYENTPIDQAIAANEEQQRAIRDAEKRAKLEKIIGDKSKSEAERRQAQLELERMALEDQRRAEEKARDEALAGIDQQIAATEAEKTAAVDAAQTKLDEAKAAKAAIDEEVAARQSMIKVQQDQNGLAREQIQLLEQMAKEAEQAAKAAAKAAQAGGAGKKPGAGGARKPGGGVKVPKPPIIGRPQGAPKRGGAGEGPDPTAPAAPQRNRRMEDLNSLQEPDTSWIGRIQIALSGLNTDALGVQSTIATVAGGIGASLSAAASTFETTRASGASFWEAWRAGAAAGVDTYIATLPGMLEATGSTLLGIVDLAMQIAPQWGAALYQYGTLAISWLAERLPTIADTVYGFSNTIINAVVDRLPAWGAALAEFSAKAWGWVLDALPGLGTSLGQFAGTIFGWLAQTTVDVVPKLLVLGGKFIWWLASDVIPQLPGVLLTFGETIFNFLSGFVTAVAPYLSAIGERFVNWVSETATPFIGAKLQEFGQAIFDWVSGYVGRAKTAWSNVGTAIVDGIRAGMAAAWGAFINWVNSKIAELPQAVRDALGIGSPSRVMADQVGRWIPAGIAQGIDRYGWIVSKSITDLFDIGSGIGSFASKIVDRFREQFIEPLQRLIDQAKEEAESFNGQLSDVDTERANILQAIANATSDDQRQNGQRRLAELETKRNRLIEQQTQVQKRQTDLQNQMLLQQKRVYALEKQRADMDFLKSQQDLLDMITKYGLDPKSILGDIQLGIGTPIEQLMEAMRRAQAAILAQMGLNFGGGPINAFSMAGGAMMPALTNPPGHNAPIINNAGSTYVYNIDARGSNWTAAQFQRMIERTIDASVQGARTRVTMNAY